MQPRYVINRVTAGDYDCPAKVASFLSDLYAAFRLLNLRNDFLRKRFDGEELLECFSSKRVSRRRTIVATFYPSLVHAARTPRLDHLFLQALETVCLDSPAVYA